MIEEFRTDDDLLRLAKWCRDRNEFADCSGDCGRTLTTCRQHGDLPIYLHPDEGPYCAICYTPEETEMPETINLNHHLDGKPIWRRVKALYDADDECSWPMATALVAEQVDGEMPHWRTVCEHAKKQEAAEAAQTPAPPAAEETPAPTPAAPPAPAEAQRVALEGSICIVRGGVSIDVFGEDFSEVREVAIRVLGGLDAA